MATHYTVTVDGGAKGNGTENVHCYGSALVETSCGKSRIVRFEDLRGASTSNEAEYGTLVAALEYLRGIIAAHSKSPGDFGVVVKMDSALVINQVTGAWKVKTVSLRPFVELARKYVGQFESVVFEKVKRDHMVAVLGH